MNAPNLHVVEPAEPSPFKTTLQRIAENTRSEREAQVEAALGILAQAAEAQAQMIEGAAVLDRLPLDVRAEFERTAAMLAVSIGRLTAGVGRARR